MAVAKDAVHASLWTPYGDMQYTWTRHAKKNMSIRVHETGSLRVSSPPWVPQAEVEAFIWERAEWIESARKEQNKRELLPADIDRSVAMERFALALSRVWPLVADTGLSQPEVKIRRMKTRWGSCVPSKGRVWLNEALAVVPEELLDYVLLHELAHFFHPNHGPDFWAFVEERMPDWKQRRKALSAYRLR